MLTRFRPTLSSLFSGEKNLKIKSDDHDAEKKLKEFLAFLLSKNFSADKQSLVIICIGTDRSTGDSLGPLIGTALKKRLPSFPLYGTLDDPIHAVNLSQKLNDIKKTNVNPFIIAIDACLGHSKSVGKIDVGTGPLQPGAGVNKSLPPVGDLYISGIVNVGGFLEYFVLQNTRLYIVMTLAEKITSSLYGVITTSLRERNHVFKNRH